MPAPLLPKAGQLRGASAKVPHVTLLLTLALGFSTGVFTGFMYHKHQEIHRLVVQHSSLEQLQEHPLQQQQASTGQSQQAAAGQGQQDSSSQAGKGSLQVVHFDPREVAQRQADGAKAHLAAEAAKDSSSATAAAAAADGSSSDLKNKEGFYRRSIWASNSNKTGLTTDDIQRISKALDEAAKKHPGDTIHALMTGNGSPYQNIQGRVMYQSLKMVQKMPGGEKITGFTRILHRTQDDALVVEFPTFRAYPLQPSCDTWCEFPVKDRANAVVQWLMAAEKDPTMIQGAWLLLLESDYVWHKPLLAPGSAHDPAVPGLAFTYDYINPQYPGVDKYIKEMCPDCKTEDVPHSGPSPVLIRPRELALVAPEWETYSAWIENNKAAADALGWVREMYAWCVGIAKHHVKITHEPPPDSRLMSQPPHDLERGNSCFYHYTWGPIYRADGKDIWHFDKRELTDEKLQYKVPKVTLPPEPWNASWKLQDGLPVREGIHEQMREMLTVWNAAVDQLPDLTGRTDRIRRGEE